MNNDLISRSDLKKAIEPYRYATGGIFEGISLIVDNAPTVEVEEIVNCMDCRYRDPENKKCDCGGMERASTIFPVHDNYFCAYGHRKEASE